MSVNGRRRVVITGIGAVTPLGNDAETSWQNLLAGESGAAEITQFDASDYFVHFACEVKDFDPSQWIDRKQARRMDRFAQMILAAARQAEADSGIDIAAEADRVGASVRCARSRGGTTTRSGRAGRSTPSATGSSWARRRRSWWSRASTTRRRA